MAVVQNPENVLPVRPKREPGESERWRALRRSSRLNYWNYRLYVAARLPVQSRFHWMHPPHPKEWQRRELRSR